MSSVSSSKELPSRDRQTPDLDPPFSKSRERRRKIAIRRWGPGYVLVLPAVILLVVMMFYPVIQTVLFSFSEVQLPNFETVFVGFLNFFEVVHDPDFGPLLQRTLIWIVGTVVLRFALGFIAALIFNAQVRGTVWMRVLVILPWTLPSVVASNLWRWILQSDGGIVNQTLRTLGIPGAALNWLGNPDTALPAVIVAYSWSGFPFVMLLILAGMQGIPAEQYEAAKVDGANWWQLFRHVTVPNVKGVLVVAVILEIVSAINSFDTLMVMTGGGPANATQILSIDIYRTAFTEYNLGGASAMSVLLFVGAITVFIVYGLVNRGRNRIKEG